MSEFAIATCVRCGIESQCILWHGQWVAPEHLGHLALASECENRRAELERLRGELTAARRTIVFLWQRPRLDTSMPDGTVATVRAALDQERARAAEGGSE